MMLKRVCGMVGILIVLMGIGSSFVFPEGSWAQETFTWTRVLQAGFGVVLGWIILDLDNRLSKLEHKISKGE